MSAAPITRRPIKARDSRWAVAAARWLAQTGLRPNQISVLSVVFAALAAGCFVAAGRAGPTARFLLLIAAAACIQLRLLCNLFDGMVAVEGGFRTKSGEIYNELPDRFADLLILTGAGYSSSNVPWLSTWGWSAGALAVVTAYVRTLGAACGAAQQFIGPMAKQQRMAVITLASLANAGLALFRRPSDWMLAALVLVEFGCIVTIYRRVRRIVKDLESR